jgi:hypothetical protein
MRVFQKVSSNRTNVDFENTLTETDTLNYFLFSYMYMGGGVSAADFNGDGYTDIYFTGNMVKNRLYLNQGNLKFRDVTDISGTSGDNRWMLGSTVCDINIDGLPDIYISVSGLSDMCRNILYVNQGNNEDGIPVFTEEAAKYGIDDNGKSTQGTFFDYDNDGDLDLYVANYPITQFQSPPYFYRQMMKNARMDQSCHLYRNNGNSTFTNVTAESGLLNFGLALSATISDLNLDGFKDIYVSNDFTSPDFYYFNNGDGTFTDRTREVTGQTSFFGMGADIADYNNDGLPDIIQIDMAPEDNVRAKENMSSMKQEDFEEMISEGLHYQYRYSTLQLNRGISDKGFPYFSNAAWLAGVTSTDWSWAGLLADFDLDGWKDLFVTNGSRRDINNIDFFNKMGASGNFGNEMDKSELLEQLKKMPYKPLVNYVFKNNGDLTFSHYSKEWGIREKSFSNGIAYADLDNDGDLELIINNIDGEAHIYKNNSRENHAGNYIKTVFSGAAKNPMGIGSVVTIWHSNKMQVAELTLSRGYQSSVEPIMYFGTGKDEIIDSLRVKWPDGKLQSLKQVKVNQKITLKYSEAGDPNPILPHAKSFVEITNKENPSFLHRENHFNDYEHQALLPHKLSATGPDITVGDVNNDDLEDFYIGNAVGSKGALFVQSSDGSFRIQAGPWESDQQYEDTGALLFDADSDGDLDLYVVSGGNEFPENSEKYTHRLYINTENAIFVKFNGTLPIISGSCVKAFDYDNDGDQDLFIGGRHVPGKYPFPARSYILENKSEKGVINFVDVTREVAPDLLSTGMVTSAFCADVDKDNWTDLVVAGEWMPIFIYKNIKGRFEKMAIEATNGWWFSIDGADFDKDGDVDLVAGNLGLNMRYRASPEKTFDVYAGDFDKDGKSDIALSYYQNNKQYPVRSRACYVNQNPGLAEKFPTYGSFARATISEVYSESLLEKSLHLQVQTFASCYFENKGNGKFIVKPLPNMAQLSALNDIIIDDIDEDGNLDIVAAGNLLNFEVVTPRNDAGTGIILKGNGLGNFLPVPPDISGFFAPGDVKSLSLVHLNNHKNKKILLAGNNNDKLQTFIINK